MRTYTWRFIQSKGQCKRKVSSNDTHPVRCQIASYDFATVEEAPSDMHYSIVLFPFPLYISILVTQDQLVRDFLSSYPPPAKKGICNLLPLFNESSTAELVALQILVFPGWVCSVFFLVYVYHQFLRHKRKSAQAITVSCPNCICISYLETLTLQLLLWTTWSCPKRDALAWLR